MNATKTDAKGKSTPRTAEVGEAPEDPITAELRRLYDDAAAEPLPDHLLRLLDKLAEAEAKR